MTPNATHLSILVGRLSLAETERDIEGQCRALLEIQRFANRLATTANKRAWIAADQKRTEQTAAFDQRQKERA